MIDSRLLIISVVVMLAFGSVLAEDGSASAPARWLNLEPVFAAGVGGGALAVGEEAKEEAPSPKKAAPLPFHTIEGYGGGAITPMAYLINPGPEGTVVGLPSVSFTFCKLGSKDLETVSITETFYRRLEIGYSFNRLGLGSLTDDIRKMTGVDLNRDEVYLHHFNIRVMLIEENSFGLPLPAVTVGVHFKYNDTIRKIDRRLGGAFQAIGMDKSNGVDYTLTATKMFPELAFGRPIILTGGMRFSNASQLGYLGFGDECSLTFEGNVAYLPTDWLVLVYEFRQKENPYDEIDELVGDEDNWHAISASWVVNEHMTITAGWLCAGNMVNARADDSWVIQMKWEF